MLKQESYPTQSIPLGPTFKHSHYSCNTQSVPGYWGRWSWYFLSRPGGTKRPPRKWYLPLNKEADFLGAVREMSMSGWRPSTLPSSTSQPEQQQQQKANRGVTIQLGHTQAKIFLSYTWETRILAEIFYFSHEWSWEMLTCNPKFFKMRKTDAEW